MTSDFRPENAVTASTPAAGAPMTSAIAVARRLTLKDSAMMLINSESSETTRLAAAVKALIKSGILACLPSRACENHWQGGRIAGYSAGERLCQPESGNDQRKA